MKTEDDMSQEAPGPKSVNFDVGVMTYDRFTYRMWSDIEIASPFFKKILPPRLRDNLKFETLRLCPTRFVDAFGDEKIGDLFYLCDAKDGERLLLAIILEHKSYYDRYAAIQTLGYAVRLLERMQERRAEFADDDGKFPTPFRVMLCQHDLPQLSDLLYVVDGAEDFGLNYSFRLVNMQTEDFDDLRDSEPFLYMALALQRFAFRVVETTDDAELLDIFSTIHGLDPHKNENVANYARAFLAFTGWFMKQKKTDFQLNTFTQRLVEMNEQTTTKGCPRTWFQEVFADVLPEEMKQNLAKMDVMHEIILEERERANKAEERADEAEERADEAEERARKAEEKFVVWFRKRICDDVKLVYGASDVGELSAKLDRLDNMDGLSLLYDRLRPSGSLETFNSYVDVAVGNRPNRDYSRRDVAPRVTDA